jgi:hypothetical protein
VLVIEAAGGAISFTEKQCANKQAARSGNTVSDVLVLEAAGGPISLLFEPM